MNKRHVQSFLMISAAFFAMNLPVRATSAATADTLAAAASHAVRMACAGVGADMEGAQDVENSGNTDLSGMRR